MPVVHLLRLPACVALLKPDGAAYDEALAGGGRPEVPGPARRQ
jgi:hypothetical protein